MTSISVKELPKYIEIASEFEILTNEISYFTHGFFKYPCKFIPQIPRWAILKYTKEGDTVLDPFAGSGTTLVEAVLNNRNALGIDFDDFSQLLCETKTKILNKTKIENIYENIDKFFDNTESGQNKIPDIFNIDHWFPQENIEDLLVVRRNISKHFEIYRDQDIYEFLLVCFASIIKKCSYADDTSPKPYVSTRFRKEPIKVKIAFKKAIESNLGQYTDYQDLTIGKYSFIAKDARQILTHAFDKKVDLAITSPPYINAFDYVRSLRLENAWLGFSGDGDNLDKKKRQIGTENIPFGIYKFKPLVTGIDILDEIVEEIYKVDKKRAHVVNKYFEDMKLSFNQVKRLLKPKAHYIFVVGDNMIKGFDIPTRDIFIKLAEKSGFYMYNYFSYIIKNRYLRIPRSGKGGLIKYDWVIDFEVNNG